MEKRRPLSPDVREFVYHRDGGLCFYCETEVSPFRAQVDHVVPISKGGPNEVANLALSCGPCNIKKGARNVEEYIGDLRHRAWELLEQAGLAFYALPGINTHRDEKDFEIAQMFGRIADYIRDRDLEFPGELNRVFLERRRQGAVEAAQPAAQVEATEGSDGSDTVH